MKTKYKFFALILLACALSIAIYYIVEKVKPVKEVNSIIAVQSKLESTFKTESYSIENAKIIVNPYGISPLSALIIFDTKDLTTPTVKIKGKDSLTSYTYTFKPGKEHYLPIYGLYADYNNEVIITLNEKDYKFNIKTDKLPEDFIKATVVTKNNAYLDNDLYFVTPSSKGYTAAYDVNGDVRWYLTESFAWDIKRLNNGHLLLGSNRLLESPYYTTGLMELDLLGKVYYEYKLPGGYHHDVVELPNSNLLVATNNFVNNTVEDYIVEIDRTTGKIVKEWDLTKILPMDQGKNEYTTDYDWFHNNSVWYDEKTHSITLSGRHMDAVVNIDYNTSEINWIIGDNSNWSNDMKGYFFTPVGNFEWQWAQHAAMILPDGNIFIFDNGNNKSKDKENYVSASNSYSRGVIYNINTNNMTIKQVWQYGKERGSDFYSPYISDVDYINKNHYLISSGGVVKVDGIPYNNAAGLVDGKLTLSSHTVEILNNKVIFEMKLPTNTYRAEKMSLYSNDTYSIINGSVLGNLAETETTKNTSVLFNKDIKEIQEEKNIDIYREYDRLVVKGTFNKTDKVQIILDNMFSKKTYNMIISTKPYTALCLDLYTGDELTITKYINSTGISGKYYVYLKINGKVYDTDKYIIF